jgi:hypothetical protein
MGARPDVLALGITTACPGAWGAIQRDIAASILPTFMEPGPNSSYVLSRVFAARKEVVLDTILSWCVKLLLCCYHGFISVIE